MDSYFKVASIQTLAPGAMKLVQVQGKSVLLVNVAGSFHAVNEVCTHRGCHLSKGTLAGQLVTCPCHDARFDVITGAVAGGPATMPVDVYPVKVQGNEVWVAV